MAWKRYKDPVSGDTFTVDEVTGEAMGLKPLSSEAAVDVNGRPLPAAASEKGGKSAASEKKEA